MSRSTKGQRCFEARKTGMSWEEVASSLGMLAPSARCAAYRYAERLRTPKVPRPDTRGERCFGLRKAGMSWREVAVKEAITETQARYRADRYAKSRGLDMGAPTKGERYYRLRKAGMSWREVAAKEGITAIQAGCRARYYAKSRGLDMPKGPRSKQHRPNHHSTHHPKPYPMDSKGKRCYDHRKTGLSWGETATIEGGNGMAAQAAAKKYAVKCGFDWPIPLTVFARLSREDKKTAQDAYNLAGTFLTRRWIEVADHLGVGPSRRLSRLAQHYAEALDLPWPVPSPNRGERAYALRSSGLDWYETADGSGFNHDSGACGAARRWAKQNGKPWPIRLEGGRHYAKDRKRRAERA